MKPKKYTQIQRIVQLEKAVSNLYMMVQALIDKVTEENENSK
jgi:hypothetical protein